jgi:hypothetical protein
MRLSAGAVAVLMSLPTITTAQVNTEKLRKAARQPGFGGNLTASGALRKGNTDNFRLTGGFRIQYETLKPRSSTTAKAQTQDLVFVVGNLVFADKASDDARERFINRGFAHVRWSRWWTERVATEVFAQVQYNEFIRLLSRTLGGVGARVTLLESTTADAYVGTGYMFEREALDIPDGRRPETECVTCQFHRWTTYVALSVKLIEDRLGLINTLYVQPRFDDFSDYRLFSDGSLTISANDLISLSIGLLVRYDSRPPLDDVDALDITVKNTLKLSF